MIEDKLNKQLNQLWFYQERKDFEESSIAWKPETAVSTLHLTMKNGNSLLTVCISLLPSKDISIDFSGVDQSLITTALTAWI